MNKTILVLGGDGYFGWPLTMRLAAHNPFCRIIIVDNQFRRNVVKTQGSDSIIPISTPHERIEAFKKVHGHADIHYINMDMNSVKLEELIKFERPATIYHLAQQCSAPYSMKSLDEALFTLHNNEGGNMRLLWAVKKHAPDTHIIKLGSFGEYAKGGIDIAEGYFMPEFHGIKATNPMPYPREADDIYHITKINDTNFVGMSCRKWGLRITDVMQSTIFGNVTDEMLNTPELYTRFDYDEAFGTVINRFVSQVVAGYPLSVYGTGEQRTGLMALRDAVNSLATLKDEVPKAGTHRVINHVTETSYSINELADTVKIIAEKEGYEVTIKRDGFDPRVERPKTKLQYGIHTHYLDSKIKYTSFAEIIRETMNLVAQYKDRISLSVFPPMIKWNDEAHKKLSVVSGHETPETAQILDEQIITDEIYWSNFRKENFYSRRINLNPGTLGTTSSQAKNARIFSAKSDEIEAHPLGLYEYGRVSLEEIHAVAGELWNSPGYKSIVVHGTSQTLNLLSLSMLRVLHKESKGPYRILTTTHEHIGGIGCFSNIPEYEVHYIDDSILFDKDKLKQKIEELQPHLAFYSHVFYDTGNKAPVEDWSKLVKRYAPNCKIIIDAAQSLGIIDLPFGDGDIILGSAHKWLFGPHGGGLMWMSNEFHNWINSLYWSGHGICTDPDLESISIPGGQDFMLYPSILESLKLYKRIGKDKILERSVALAAWFQKKLNEILSGYGHEYVFLNNPGTPVISLGFTEYDPFHFYKMLNEKQVHIKCVKDHKIGNQNFNILRFGFPYFETYDRLEFAIQQIKGILQELEPEVKVLKFGT